MAENKLFIFDLDGTLIDAYPAIIDSFNFTMAKLCLPCVSPSIIRKSVGRGDENLLLPFTGRLLLKKALSVYRKHHSKALLSGSRLFPQTREVLRGLKEKGYLLAVASNRPTRFSGILIKHLRIDRYFDYVLCADKLKRGKPDPLILNKIMKRLHVKPSNSFYVGDMVIDAQAGRRAGVKSIIVTTGSSSRAEIKRERPYKIIRHIGSLLKLA
ncbi:MAG: HAD family hydrolase [Candidatus Omnitrophota bacterium]|jgi:phosphoglycolate phosphatase|nr:MAG: HAD family hydrolase [Candidatus Omnitrophota bacterium]